MRTSRPALAAALAGVVALVAVGALLVSGGDEPAPRAAPSPSSSATPPPSPSPPPPSSASASAAPAPFPGGSQARFAGAVLQLPAGYLLRDESPGQACLVKGGAEAACVLTLLRPAVLRAGGQEFEDPTTETDGGWYRGTDVPGCGADGEVRSTRRTERGTRPVGDRTADFARWAVVCADGTPLAMALWLLPRSGLAFLVGEETVGVEQAPLAELQGVLDRVDLSGLRPR